MSNLEIAAKLWREGRNTQEIRHHLVWCSEAWVYNRIDTIKLKAKELPWPALSSSKPHFGRNTIAPAVKPKE